MFVLKSIFKFMFGKSKKERNRVAFKILDDRLNVLEEREKRYLKQINGNVEKAGNLIRAKDIQGARFYLGKNLLFSGKLIDIRKQQLQVHAEKLAIESHGDGNATAAALMSAARVLPDNRRRRVAARYIEEHHHNIEGDLSRSINLLTVPQDTVDEQLNRMVLEVQRENAPVPNSWIQSF